MPGSRLIILWICIALTTISAAYGAEMVSPGVEYTAYNLPHPNVAHVIKLDLTRPEYKLKMGFPQKKRNYSSREKTSTIASRYDSPPSHDVIAAVNGSFFDTGITINGILGGSNNYLQLPTNTWETYMFADARWGLISRSISSSGSKVTFADSSTITVDKLNFTRAVDQLVVYTPEWDTSTKTSVQGTEVVLSNVSYPMRPDKEVTGVVTSVRTGSQSLNNSIPTGGMVLSAEGTKATTLAASVQEGDRVKIRPDISSTIFNNASFMITGAGWIVHNGAAYTDMWSYYSDSFKGRNPRTMIAWNSTHLFLIAVDGRQTFSVGMTFQEMADFCIGYLGATECVNLDGGGSTALWVNGQVKNSPSDSAGERSVGNAVLLVKQDTSSTLPIQDSFPSTGRQLTWDDKFVYNGVFTFSPTAPGGDGYAVVVKDSSGGAETIHVGDLADADYAVEAQIYCEYRANVASNGYERYGIYARDNGNNAFTLGTLGGGYCYAMTYDTNDGRIRAGKIVNGTITDFSLPTIYCTTSAWHKMRIECLGPNIKYYLDDSLIANVLDTTYERGYSGIGFHEFFTTNSNMHGTRADNFRVTAPPAAEKISGAKSLAVGLTVVLNGVTVTGSLPSAALFYVRDGASGIGVQKNSYVSTMPTAGTKVAVIGTTAHAAPPYSHEIIVIPTDYVIIPGTSEVTPLGSVNRDTGGGESGNQPGVADDISAVPPKMSASLNNVGSLATVWGNKTSGGIVGDRFCWIDDGSSLNDGSGTGIRLDLSELGNNMPVGSYFKVTGILRCGTSSGPEALPIRVLWPRSSYDIIIVR